MIICQYSECGVLTSSLQDALAHDKVHQRTHRRAKFFTWWLGEYLGEYIRSFEYVSGLDTIEMIDGVLYINNEMMDGYYTLYKNYLKGTCKDEPCMECIAHNKIRTMPEKRYQRYKLERDGIYEPDKPRITPRTMNLGDYPD